MMRWTILLLARHFSSSFHYLSAIWFKSTFQTETKKCCTEKNSLEDAICDKLGITVSQIVKDFDNYDERVDDEYLQELFFTVARCKLLLLMMM